MSGSFVRSALAVVLAVLVVGCAEQTKRVSNDYRFDDNRAKGPGNSQNPDERILELQSLIATEPDQPKHYFDLGDLYENLGQKELAVHYYRKLVSKVPADSFTGPYYRLGRMLALSGQMDEAVVWLTRCVSVKQKFPDVYYANPDYREGHFLLGTIYYSREDTKKMVHNYKEFLRLGGDEGRIGHILAKIVDNRE